MLTSEWFTLSDRINQDLVGGWRVCFQAFEPERIKEMAQSTGGRCVDVIMGGRA